MVNSKTLIILLIILAAIVGYAILSHNKKATTTTTMPQSPNSQKPSATELKIEDTLVGTGREVKSGDTVSIHYKGTLTDGTKFDSSYDRNEPFETQIGVGRVIQGWDKGVVGMKVGGKRKLTIPPSMGYGDRATGPIPANSTLIFEVELMDVK
ncbi:hypothetical protein BH09PAT2_BH09PAT2_03200 [soil metagenome]